MPSLLLSFELPEGVPVADVAVALRSLGWFQAVPRTAGVGKTELPPTTWFLEQQPCDADSASFLRAETIEAIEEACGHPPTRILIIGVWGVVWVDGPIQR